MAIAGRVAIVPKGDWSADATYKRLDAVTYNNTLYFAKKNVPAGTETSNTEYWSKSIVGSAVIVDDALSSTSTNPVQNKVVTSNLDGLGYGENGAKNLFEDEIKWIENIPVERGTKSVSDGKITLTATSDDCFTSYDALLWKNNGIKTIPCKPNTTYTFSWEYEGDATGSVYIFENGSTNNMNYESSKKHKLLITTSADAEYLIIRVGVYKTGNSITYWNFQIEEGDTATPYEPYIPSVKMLAEEKADKSETTVNLLKPTLQTTTLNGITCTNNGDGTYTLNGTANAGNTYFDLIPWSKIAVGNYMVVGCPIGGSIDRYSIEINVPNETETNTYYVDTGSGVTFETYNKAENIIVRIKIIHGTTASNLVFKPMLTTNLSATYDDFVPYTGDTGKLNGDVAELNKTVDTLKKSVSDGKTKVANAITGKGVETATDATFDVMAKNISKIDTELHGATLAVSTSDNELFGDTVTLILNGANVGTTVFASNGTCSFVVQKPGAYTITCGEAHKDVTVTSDNVLNKTVISVNLSLLKIVTFSGGTDEEIAKMIQAHYNNKINIADYWAVGDTRSVSLSAMSATGVGESHRAQTVQFVIGDFNHDDLATPINGHSKAAVTLLQKDCLMDAANASNPVNGESNTENGYMNSSNTNVGGWKNCARRTWCNNVFFAALPSAWQSMVKTVNKKSGIGNGSSSGTEVTEDKIFLASEIEIFGSKKHSVDGEGAQYQYYKIASINRHKIPKWNSNSASNIYWERSTDSGDATNFCGVYAAGIAGAGGAGNAFGIAPCLCI